MTFRQVLAFAKGFLQYRRTLETPPHVRAYLNQIFASTGGYSHLILHALNAATKPKIDFPAVQGIVPLEHRGGFLREMRKIGTHTLAKRLAPATCGSLVDFALRTPCQPVGSRGIAGGETYPRAKPEAEAYYFAESDILPHPEIQRLLCDYSLLQAAQEYLGCAPVLNNVSLWWSTSYQREASSRAAQLFHYDLDGIKWIKFFFYLTDVTAETGPHSFIAGTHRVGGKPRELLSRGQVRISDEDVARHFTDDKLLSLTGPAGTGIAEDSSGFHKGTPLLKGDRLMMQIEFTDSLFGSEYSPLTVPLSADSPLGRTAAGYPGVFARYRFPVPGRRAA